MENIKGLLQIMAAHGMRLPDEKVNISIDEPEKKVKELFGYFVPGFVWNAEYSEICEWLNNNKGLGLLMHGRCGTGKTIFGRYILPAIILSECRKVVKCYDFEELNTKPDEIIDNKLISIDDVGNEGIRVNYGEKRLIFAELMDMVEKKSKLIIITTNLSAKELETQYGERVLDRIYSTTKRIAFNGKSYRKLTR